MRHGGGGGGASSTVGWKISAQGCVVHQAQGMWHVSHKGGRGGCDTSGGEGMRKNCAKPCSILQKPGEKGIGTGTFTFPASSPPPFTPPPHSP